MNRTFEDLFIRMALTQTLKKIGLWPELKQDNVMRVDTEMTAKLLRELLQNDQ